MHQMTKPQMTKRINEICARCLGKDAHYKVPLWWSLDRMEKRLDQWEHVAAMTERLTAIEAKYSKGGLFVIFDAYVDLSWDNLSDVEIKDVAEAYLLQGLLTFAYYNLGFSVDFMRFTTKGASYANPKL